MSGSPRRSRRLAEILRGRDPAPLPSGPLPPRPEAGRLTVERRRHRGRGPDRRGPRRTLPGDRGRGEERAQTDATRPADLFLPRRSLDGTRDFLAGTRTTRSTSRWCPAPARWPPPWRPRGLAGSGGRAQQPSRARWSPAGRGPGGRSTRDRRRRPASSPWAAGGTAIPKPPPASRRCRPGDAPGRIRLEVRADRRRRGGHLRALRPDHGMGYGRGRSHRRGGGGLRGGARRLARSATGSTGPIIATGPSRPWAIPPWPRASPCRPAGRRGRSARRIHRRDVLQGTQGRPRRLRLPDQVGLGQEPGAALGIPEQVEALADHREDQGIGITSRPSRIPAAS